MGGEQWRAAEAAFEAYLKEDPEDPEKVEADLAKARKYARISEDYNAAQEMINKRQFNKAVPYCRVSSPRTPPINPLRACW